MIERSQVSHHGLLIVRSYLEQLVHTPLLTVSDVDTAQRCKMYAI